jgi:hypothetical protein
MSSDLNFIACLRLDHVPHLLLNLASYNRSNCDLCGGAIWLPKKAIVLVQAGEAGKACTACLGARLQLCERILAGQQADSPC